MFFAACPLTGPLSVCTVCPTVQLAAWRRSRLKALAQSPAARVRSTDDFMTAMFISSASENAGKRQTREGREGWTRERKRSKND